MWRLNFAQIAGFDDILTAKEKEVTDLKARIRELETSRGSDAHTLPASEVPSAHLPRSPSTHILPSGRTAILPTTSSTHSRRGKAPPVSEGTCEDQKCQLDDWLPTLERTCMCNSRMEEKLIQLAYHLRGWALQEYNPIRPEDPNTFTLIIDILRLRLDVGSKAVVAQDFRHSPVGHRVSFGLHTTPGKDISYCIW